MGREPQVGWGRAARTGAAWIAVAGLAAGLGCGGRKGARTGDPAVNVGLSRLAAEGGMAELDEPSGTEAAETEAAGTEAAPDQDFETFVSDHVAALDAALGDGTLAPVEAGTEPGISEEAAATDLSLAALSAGQDSPEVVSPEQAPQSPPTAVADAPPVIEPVDPAARVDSLYAELNQALGQELEATSEPFRTAVGLLAIAAAQGRDPLAAIAPETPAGSRLSPAERESAEAVAGLLATLLSPGEADEAERAGVLRELAERLTQNIGLRIPRVELCTRVRGFGKYEPFAKTDFLAGRPVRALVYAELEGFEHRPVDTSRLGGLVPEDQWSVEVSEELQLYHVADGRLAWRRPAEKVVETSRNRQRDFYLLAEVELPPTLTVGSYDLKVIIRDDVAGTVAEKVLPIGIVADPELAWSPG